MVFLGFFCGKFYIVSACYCYVGTETVNIHRKKGKIGKGKRKSVHPLLR